MKIEDTFIADLKMDSFDKRRLRENDHLRTLSIKGYRCLKLKFHHFHRHGGRNTWHISVRKKNFQIMNLDL